LAFCQMKNWAISYYDGFLDFSTFLIKSCIRVSKEDFWKHSRCQGQIVFNFLLTNEWTMDSLIKLWSNNICNPQGKGLLPEQAFPMEKYKKPFYLNAGRFACKQWKGRLTRLLINQSNWLATHQPMLSGSNSNFHPTLVWGEVLEGIL